MSGSRKDVLYDLSPDNSGQFYYMNVDESNHELMLADGGQFKTAEGESVFDITPANVTTAQIPLMRDGKNFRRRMATYETLSGQVKRIPIPSQAVETALQLRNSTDINLNITDPTNNEVYALSRVRGQEIAVPREFDTGLDDGDAS